MTRPRLVLFDIVEEKINFCPLTILLLYNTHMSNNSPTNEDLIALQNDQEHEDSYSLTITEPVSVSRQSSLNDVIDSDIDIANNVLKALHAGWSRVRSISSLTKMADTTLNAIEKRRKILNLQYGAEAKYSKGSVVYPMD